MLNGNGDIPDALTRWHTYQRSICLAKIPNLRKFDGIQKLCAFFFFSYTLWRHGFKLTYYIDKALNIIEFSANDWSGELEQKEREREKKNCYSVFNETVGWNSNLCVFDRQHNPQIHVRQNVAVWCAPLEIDNHTFIGNRVRIQWNVKMAHDLLFMPLSMPLMNIDR